MGGGGGGGDSGKLIFWFLEFPFLDFSLGMETPKTRFWSLFKKNGPRMVGFIDWLIHELTVCEIE